MKGNWNPDAGTVRYSTHDPERDRSEREDQINSLVGCLNDKKVFKKSRNGRYVLNRSATDKWRKEGMNDLPESQEGKDYRFNKIKHKVEYFSLKKGKTAKKRKRVLRKTLSGFAIGKTAYATRNAPNNNGGNKKSK
jgi:hypothetical protein